MLISIDIRIVMRTLDYGLDDSSIIHMYDSPCMS
jgi:hypothetical protein